MKLCFYNDYRLGVIQGERVYDAQRAVQEFGQQSPQGLLEMLIASWAEMQSRLADAIKGVAGLPLLK